MLSDETIQAAIDRLVLDGIFKYRSPPLKIRVNEADFEVTEEEINNCVYNKSEIIITNDSLYTPSMKRDL